MNVREIIRRRFAGQFLTTPGPAKASDVVRALGAVQAQDYTGAKWALGQRARGINDADIEREMTEGRFLRTHVLRPTWHFVAPEDIRWMLKLTAPRVSAAMASYDRQLGLDARVYARSNAAIAKALEGGKHLTRTELGRVLQRSRLGITSGQRLGHLMMRAELDAIVCSGPRRGKQFTYALLDERVPPAALPERDEALLDLTRRYFTTRGPATVHDFAWWSGLSMADARRGIEIAGKALEHSTVNDCDVWFVDRPLPRASQVAHLLPNYDEYFIGYKDRSAIGGRVRTPSSRPGDSAFFAHLVFVNGELVGGWKRFEAKKSIEVRLELVAQLTAAERARVTATVRKLGVFLGTTVRERKL